MACTKKLDSFELTFGIRAATCRVYAGLLIAFLLGAVPSEASESFQGVFATQSLVFSEGSPAEVSSPAYRSVPLESTETQVRYRTLGAYAAGVTALAVYANKNWWGDGFEGEFRSVDEGWFGQDTRHGGTDKLGHGFATYVGTRLFERAFEWAGNDEKTSLRLAVGSVLGTFTVVEILDGFTTRWKFSAEDAIMNALGAGLAVVMETSPQLDRLLDFRLLYKPSGDSSRRFDPFGDYSGQTYLLAAKASGVPGLRERGALRYIELAVGYGTRGYQLDQNVSGDRSRNVYYGVSINLAELLDQTVFRGAARKSPAQRAVNGFLEVVQIPGTAALTHQRQ